MFYVIGLGLSDEKDITLRGLEVCRNSHMAVSNSLPYVLPFDTGYKRLDAGLSRSVYEHSDDRQGPAGV